MNQDKKKLILIAIGTFTMVLGLVPFVYLSIKNNEVNMQMYIPVIIVVLITIFMVIFITKKARDVKKGLPLEDELSKRVINRAAAISFYVTLYWLMAISMFEPLFAKMFNTPNLTASQTTGGGIAGMVVIFMISWGIITIKSRSKNVL